MWGSGSAYHTAVSLAEITLLVIGHSSVFDDIVTSKIVAQLAADIPLEFAKADRKLRRDDRRYKQHPNIICPRCQRRWSDAMWNIVDQANAQDDDSASVPCDGCGHIIELRKADIPSELPKADRKLRRDDRRKHSVTPRRVHLP
jgi:hypothetical protein